MGCCITTGDIQPTEVCTTPYPVPFGHVPYTPALPGAMGPLWGFPVEWWYYGGWASDETGSQQFTIMMDACRLSQNQSLTIAGLLYGIGSASSESTDCKFFSNFGGGFGKFPLPTSTSWSISLETTEPIQSTMNCKLISGVLGLSGAKYQLEMADTTNEIAASLVLKDTFGMILEGGSGAYKGHDENSYEFAMPSLKIEEGSSITLDGVKTALSKGSLWLDRQTDWKSSKHGLGPGESKSLYIGNWLAVTMNDQTNYMFAFIWPPKKDQWIVGTKINPPVYPTRKIGIEYPALPSWDEQSPVQGVNVLESTNFDLNILKPDDPSESPHWNSPASGLTYSTSWELRIKEKAFKVVALIPESEVKVGLQAFFEGIAIVSDENGCKVGRAFVEEMGYN